MTYSTKCARGDDSLSKGLKHTPVAHEAKSIKRILPRPRAESRCRKEILESLLEIIPKFHDRNRQAFQIGYDYMSSSSHETTGAL